MRRQSLTGLFSELPQLLADEHDRYVNVHRVRGKRRTLLHQIGNRRVSGRS